MASSLLHRQLASITDTLLRASQHQDTILRDRANMPSKHTPTMPTHTLESTLSVPSKAQLPHTGGSRRSSLGFEYEDEDSGSAAGGCQLQDTGIAMTLRICAETLCGFTGLTMRYSWSAAGRPMRKQ
ncbi:hypothetical protein ACJQWK_09724 [Exserohilum turcicum]